MRFLPAGDAALLVELAHLDAALALFQDLQASPLAGVREVVPAARTVLLTYAPWETSAANLAARLSARHEQIAARTGQAHPEPPARRCVEIPVRYEGEDLPSLAEQLGLSVAQVIARHTEPEYLAAFAGFAPGFVYLAGGHPDLRVPRLPMPRTRVPAGSVAMAGEFSAIYPTDSPGGWQLLGVTPCTLWDMQRAEPALLQPGFHVRFRDLAHSTPHISLPAADASAPADAPAREAAAAAPASPRGTPVRCVSTGLQTLVQDAGRPGQTGLGIAASGALDQGARRAANEIVGNPTSAPVLENLLGQLTLRSDGPAVVAVTGASVDVHITTAQGHTRIATCYQPLALYDGDTLSIGAPRAGMRCYVALRGGLDLPAVLGSYATDTLARIGPAPLRDGDTLWVGQAIPRDQLRPVRIDAPAPDDLPTADGIVTLDIVLGPRTDWFTPAAVDVLLGQAWTVTPQSNRIGMRLSGAQPLTRHLTGELPSEGTVVGAIQVPASGQPVLFLADRPLTGGYPVIGAVISRHLDRAAQIPVGARIRFRVADAESGRLPDTPASVTRPTTPAATHDADPALTARKPA